MQVFQCIFYLPLRNSFSKNIDNTKFENYLQSCFEIRFVLSKFKTIVIHCYEYSSNQEICLEWNFY